MEAVIFTGIQATGKSTFFKERFADTHIRINLDMLRTRRREFLLFEACLKMKQPFVVDNTSPTAEDRQRYIPMAKAAKFRITSYYFVSNIKDAIMRNSERDCNKFIPSYAIMGTHGRLESPTYEEGFDMIYCVRIKKAGGFAVKDWKVR
ncbi:MAG: hypothetical protein WC637_22020 [Victivallales bacterium]|jgi:predicted kinase